jgi:glutathione-specific gamma-glutamylcyclotransferase
MDVSSSGPAQRPDLVEPGYAARVHSLPPQTEGCWIFGYGSLLWRPAFPHLQRLPGLIRGWARRYWQASTDHRGLPDAPGRVVTLIPALQDHCWGIAFRVAPDAWESVIETLDYRERGGFERTEVTVEFRDSDQPAVRALVYVANERNPNYLGPASEAEIAAQIRDAQGPSGSNVEYALELAAALRRMQADDEHVFAVADILSAANPLRAR